MHKNISTENTSCASCQAFLPECSYVIQDFYLWLTKNFPDCHICQGFRSEADQHADFLAGKSKLDYPRSAHNNLKDGQPFSEAIDVFQLLPNGQAAFSPAYYQDIYNALLNASQPISWGGKWLTLVDEDHFQNASWNPPA